MFVARLALVGALTLGFATAAFAAPINLVQNGSFEDRQLASGTIFTAIPRTANPSALVPGWTVLGTLADDGVDLKTSLFQPAQDGNQYIDLDGTTSDGRTIGGISQVVTGLEVGKTYKLSFWLDANKNEGDPKPFRLTIESDTALFIQSAFDVFKSAPWTEYVYTFIADDTAVTLFFESLTTSGQSGAMLDNVSLTVVPLPLALPMFLAGLGALGLIQRRRTAPAA